MDDAAEKAARDAAIAFAQGIAEFWRRRLAERVLGVYLIGSLAHGGFSRRYSDIDMAVVAEDGLEPADLDAMGEAAQALSQPHAAKLSLFWADRAFSIGRFPPLDRLDYLDHAVALAERERAWPERPALSAIRGYLRGQPLASWVVQSHGFAAVQTLEQSEHKPYLRCLLYPARLLLSWSLGAIASNDDAVAFTRENAPPGLDVGLVERALRCRQDAADPVSLFSERTKLLDQLAACARVLDG
jgi:hypothetical protein